MHFINLHTCLIYGYYLTRTQKLVDIFGVLLITDLDGHKNEIKNAWYKKPDQVKKTLQPYTKN